MKKIFQVWALAILFACGGFMGCDSSKEAVDDITGKKSVEQFQKSKKDIDNTVKKQADRFKDISDDKKGDKDSEDTEDKGL
jgi:hypothetical protein